MQLSMASRTWLPGLPGHATALSISQLRVSHIARYARLVIATHNDYHKRAVK